MKRKRARPQTVQERFSELFVGPEHLWSRLLGHIQGDGHVTKQGNSIVLGTACEAHGDKMALALSPRECEHSLAAPVTYVLSSRGRELDDAQKGPEARNISGNRQKFWRQHQEMPFHWAIVCGSCMTSCFAAVYTFTWRAVRKIPYLLSCSQTVTIRG